MLQWTQSHFASCGVDQPKLSAEVLLAHCLGCRKIDLYSTRFEHKPNEAARAAIRDMIRQASQHRPIAYLVGKKEFYSLEFEVTPDVLIPRPETEKLVEQTLDVARSRCGGGRLDFLDMGTGSGCVGVAVCHQYAEAYCLASDISEAALAVAGRNAQRLGVAGRFRTVAADALALPPGAVPAGGFDLIVSNPPYVAEDELDRLDANVREYEPRLALSAGPDGLVFYRKMAADAGGLLKDSGALLCEIGYDQHDAVAEIFAASGRFEHIGSYRDSVDPHHRVLEFRLK